MCSFGKDGKVKCPEYDSHPTGNSNRYAIPFTTMGLSPSGSYGLDRIVAGTSQNYKPQESYKEQ